MLRRKLLIRVGLLIAAFVCGAVVAIYLLQNALGDIEKTNRDAAVLIGGIQTVGGAVTSIRSERALQRNPSNEAAAADRLRQAMQSIGEHAVVSGAGSPAGASFERLRAIFDEFLKPVDGSVPGPAQADSVGIEEAVQGLGDDLRAYVASEQADLGRSFRALVLGLTLAALVMVNVAIVVLLRTAQVVLKPVAALVQGSRELAAERFEHRVVVDQEDEFAELAHAYNLLAGQLQANEERKAEALRQLAATLNHALNNAMSVIELQLGLLDRRSGGNPMLDRHLLQIRANLSQMSGTVASLKNIRRVVLTEYIPGQTMLDLPRSLAPSTEDAA